ncbi:MAG: HAD family hydrolase [Akkermansiaceae bacterium]|nr:HAD family hydrolase [Akkermansiaceae bacterium]MDP4646949.1 HAD family hydrolase [Akkermansiaceae bacterium]MDP4780180.1 HAD family hydrolase [Akkermansiaceae bacterium]MDP4847572.1 HAD family hydrolase [Akkermansiaceae bacterium]MDP4897966.1 HAD family hydrolase [Akkermansiaceae bacterium]
MKLTIAFDAAGTLFEPAEPVADIYAERFSKHGFNIPPAIWKNAFGKAFLTAPDPIFPKNGDGEAIEKDWWFQLVLQAAKTVGIQHNTAAVTSAFEEIFAYYATGASWKLFPETETVLTSFKSKGISLAITSNFDSRIHRVIEELGIAHHFDLILTSADARARKPSPNIIHKLFDETGAAPTNTCLTGDSLTHDKGTAEAAGIPFYHINRPTTDLLTFETWYSETFLRK